MAVREILLYSENKRALRKKSKPVQGATQDVKQLIGDLKDILNASIEGIGLAAPQINIHKHVILVRLGATGDGGGEPGAPIPLINPRIIEVVMIAKTSMVVSVSLGCIVRPVVRIISG